MAELIKQALALVYSRKDEEAAMLKAEEERKHQKRIKLLVYIGIFIVFQIIVITVFALTVMEVKSPKVRLGAINVQTLNSAHAPPSFDTSFTTQIRVKNTNWGPYKFDEGIATFMYQGVAVGQVVIPKSKADMRSTKKINVEVNLSTNGLPSNSNLESELSNGVLTLSSQAKLTGKVQLMLIMKKKKSANMDCTMKFDLSTKRVQSLECK